MEEEGRRGYQDTGKEAQGGGSGGAPVESSSDRSSAVESNLVASQHAEEAWAAPATAATGGPQGEVS